jgi:hypothetical protein
LGAKPVEAELFKLVFSNSSQVKPPHLSKNYIYRILLGLFK